MVSFSGLDENGYISSAYKTRLSSGGPWRSVAVDPQRIATSGPARTGEVTWRLEQAPRAELVEIRARVADTAGNATIGGTTVDLVRRY